MELYRKKIKVGSKKNPRITDQYNETENSLPNEDQNTYLQKVIEKKNVSQPKNEASNENIQNARSSIEDIFSNENNKKKAIQYVIQIGKNKKIPNNYSESNNPEQFSEKPKFSRSYKNSPSKNINEQQRKNKYTSANNYPNNDMDNQKRRQKTIDNDIPRKKNQEQNESQNEEMSSLVEEERVREYRRSPEPYIMNKINSILQDRYEKASRRPQQSRRNRNIQAMPQIRKYSNNPRFTNYRYNYGNNNYDENDDIDDLIKTIKYL